MLSLLSAQAGHFYDAVHIQPESQIWAVVREGTRNCLVGITHNTGSKINSRSSLGSCKAQQGVIFDTGNLVRMMLFFTKPKRQFLRFNKDGAEAAAFGPENSTWERFFLGRSRVETQHSKGEKIQSSLCVPELWWGSVCLAELQGSKGGTPTPSCSPLPSFGNYLGSHKLKSLEMLLHKVGVVSWKEK